MQLPQVIGWKGLAEVKSNQENTLSNTKSSHLIAKNILVKGGGEHWVQDTVWAGNTEVMASLEHKAGKEVEEAVKFFSETI